VVHVSPASKSYLYYNNVVNCDVMRYKIEPELEAVCLPLTPEEYGLLESQILRDGCLDPVKVWDRDGELVLLDGHNRLKICRENKLPEPISSTIEIGSLDEAVIWIVDNQKGRRNVATEAQQTYISGKRYEAQKNVNKFKGNQYTIESGARTKCEDQNAPHNKNYTAYKQGSEEGISSRTIEKNAVFSKGIDAIREVSPELADKILTSGTTKLAKVEVMAVSKIPPNELREVVAQGVEAIKSKVKDIRAAEKERKFQEEFKEIKEERKQMKGTPRTSCSIGVVQELICTECRCPFDIVSRDYVAKRCPACGSVAFEHRDYDPAKW